MPARGYLPRGCLPGGWGCLPEGGQEVSAEGGVSAGGAVCQWGCLPGEGCVSAQEGVCGTHTPLWTD